MHCSTEGSPPHTALQVEQVAVALGFTMGLAAVVAMMAVLRHMVPSKQHGRVSHLAASILNASVRPFRRCVYGLDCSSDLQLGTFFPPPPSRPRARFGWEKMASRGSKPLDQVCVLEAGLLKLNASFPKYWPLQPLFFVFTCAQYGSVSFLRVVGGSHLVHCS